MAPLAFTMTFSGPEGDYVVNFRPKDEWDGIIDFTLAGVAMRWEVVDCDRGSDGLLVLGGMTSGSERLWRDQFWFELRVDDVPPVIRYWGDKVVWREDRSIQPRSNIACHQHFRRQRPTPAS